MENEMRKLIDQVKNLGKSLNENVISKIALYFTSKYGLQTKEFEDFLNENNIEFKKKSGNIFIPNSEITNYELVVDNITKKKILVFIKNNRLDHIEKTGEHLIQVED